MVNKKNYSKLASLNYVKAPKKGTGDLLEVRDFSSGLKEASRLESHLCVEINLICWSLEADLSPLKPLLRIRPN